MMNRNRVFSKIVLIMLIFSIFSFQCVNCTAKDIINGENNQVVPEYPLTETFINEMLGETELFWKAITAKHANVMENQTMYELYDEEERIIASISSYADEKGRFLMIGFMPPILQGKLIVSAGEDTWEKIMVLAAKLYGGLQDKQIYEDFVSDFEAEAHRVEYEETKGAVPAYTFRKVMTKEYGEIFSRIIMGYTDDASDRERFLHSITLYYDKSHLLGKNFVFEN